MRSIIEEPRSSKAFGAGHSATEIIRFFGSSQDQPFMTLWQNIRLYNSSTKVSVSQRGRVTRKNAPRGLLSLKALISDDPIIARFDGCSEGWNCGVRKVIYFSVERCTGSYELFDSKLALRQRRYVLIQGILSSQQLRFKSLGLLRTIVERVTNKSRQCDVITDRYWRSIHQYGWRYIIACMRTFQTENRGRHSS